MTWNLKIGMVFQSYALKQQKVPKKERLKRAKEAADMVQLGHLLDRKPSELSGGQQQRVALARAIVKRPRLLLLDEPMSNLDAGLRIEMRAEISRLQKKLGITSILITHDQEEAMTLANRIALMKDGRIVQFDTPMKLYREPDDIYVAKFIGTPPMNLIEGKVVYNQLQIGDKKYKIDEKKFSLKNGNEVIFGVRPHDVQVGWKEDLRFLGEVQSMETIGHSNMLHVKIGGENFRFFTEPHINVALGKKIQFSVDPDNVHLFDKNTGKSLREQEPEIEDEDMVEDVALT